MNKKISETDETEIAIHRLISFANFLSGVAMNKPLGNEGFTVTKTNDGFMIGFDNFTFSWAIGMLPLVFGKYWAYSSKENVILKERPELCTALAIQYFFQLSALEYLHCFVAYFQSIEEMGGKLLRHDVTSGADIAFNLQELAKKKVIQKSKYN